MAPVRSVKAAATGAVTYTNRLDDTYYLHEGTTKTGKPRYFFAKSVGEGALGQMPQDFEVSESINGVVSVRRRTAGAPVVPDEGVKAVEAIVGRHAHLRGYIVRAVGNAVVIFEPHPRPEQLRELAKRGGLLHGRESFIEDRMKKAQYLPVMKFQRECDDYVLYRMTYRGKGGWSWPLGHGDLTKLARTVVAKVGTDEFCELI